MGQDFEAYLPPEIIMNILSRLPFRSILRFRCVCKLWLSLIETHEFIKSYFLNSSFPDGLALFQDETSSKQLKILEFTDEGNSAHPCLVGSNFSFATPHHEIKLHSSANGLLFLINHKTSPQNLFICNPISREYIKLLPPPKKASFLDTYGFGVGKLTGQYKVVRMLRGHFFNSPITCEVYTVGTGSWRSIAADVPLMQRDWISSGVFFNGNLHWLGLGSGRILCFDLETERFSMFSTLLLGYGCICALGDCLYLFQNSSAGILIWLLNENGGDKSWRRELIFKMPCQDTISASFYPIKIFRDGDIWFAGEYRLFSSRLFCYSGKTKTIREITRPELVGRIHSRVVSYTPNFSPLKTFALENVSSF